MAPAPAAPPLSAPLFKWRGRHLGCRLVHFTDVGGFSKPGCSCSWINFIADVLCQVDVDDLAVWQYVTYKCSSCHTVSTAFWATLHCYVMSIFVSWRPMNRNCASMATCWTLWCCMRSLSSLLYSSFRFHSITVHCTVGQYSPAVGISWSA